MTISSDFEASDIIFVILLHTVYTSKFSRCIGRRTVMQHRLILEEYDVYPLAIQKREDELVEMDVRNGKFFSI